MDSYLVENMYCLVELLEEVDKLYPDLDYVMFDPDANIEEQFREFTW